MIITERSREEVIADLIMQQHPELMDNLGKHMNGELELPPDVAAKVVDHIAAEKEINEIYTAAEREGISSERLDAGYKAYRCPIDRKMQLMETCFPIIACVEYTVLQKAMCLDLAESLMLEVSLVLKDYKKWWKKHHKGSGFPLHLAQNSVRNIKYNNS